MSKSKNESNGKFEITMQPFGVYDQTVDYQGRMNGGIGISEQGWLTAWYVCLRDVETTDNIYSSRTSRLIITALVATGAVVFSGAELWLTSYTTDQWS